MNNPSSKQAEIADEEKREAHKRGALYWRTTEEYKAMGWQSLAADVKRWEFLRRCDAYRQAFLGTIPPPKENRKWKFLSPKREVGRSISPAAFTLSCYVSPLDAWADRPAGTIFFRAPPPRTSRIVYPLNSREEPPEPPTWGDYKVWIEFDLNVQIEKQIADAKGFLADALSKTRKIEAVAALGAADWDNGAPCDECDEPAGKQRKAREANKRPKNGGDNLDEQSYIISLLRICDGRICGATFKAIADQLSDEEPNISENTVQKRYTTAQSYWSRL